MMNFLLVVLITTVYISDSADPKHVLKRPNKNKKLIKGVFMNSWAVVVHGDENMANKVSAENGFINKGKVGEYLKMFFKVFELVITLCAYHIYIAGAKCVPCNLKSI